MALLFLMGSGEIRGAQPIEGDEFKRCLRSVEYKVAFEHCIYKELGISSGMFILHDVMTVDLTL